METTEVRSAQRVVETLSAYGIQYIFGVPGAKIDAVFDTLVDGLVHPTSRRGLMSNMSHGCNRGS